MFAVDPCCMIFAGLVVHSVGLNDSPVVFGGRVSSAVSVEASVFEFFLVFGDSTQEDELFLEGSQRVTVPGDGVVGRFWFDFRPLALCEPVEVGFEAVVEGTGAGDATVDVDGFLGLAVGDVVA